MPVAPSRKAAEGLRFTRLRLMNWRNFREAELHLGALAFIVGPNASGKSNLLSAFRFLGHLAQTGSGGLRGFIPDRRAFSGLRCLEARKPAHVEVEADIGTDDEAQRWSYSLRIDVRLREAFPTVLSESVRYQGEVVAEQTRAAGDDALGRSQTLMEQVGANKPFRELQEFLASARYLHVVPQIVRDRRRALMQGDDPHGGDLLRRMKETSNRTRDARLKSISKALQIAVPQFERLDLEDDTEGVPHLRAWFRNWRPNAAKQDETSFSDGTLRFIGLLWSIAERGGPLLLEEPELSLNDAVIEELPRMFERAQRSSKRQLIMTTHSSSLLSSPSIGLADVHRIYVDGTGSHIETLADNEKVAAQVDGGLSVREALMPLLSPQNVKDLSSVALTA